MKDQPEPESSETNNDATVHVQEGEVKVCPTRLIEDSPADEDLLSFDDGDIGPHERVSQAIADLVQSDEPGGKMIGLEGGWGAGKTTVIKLLQKRLEADCNILVFPFDAWAHEGDPLRRTYLESIIECFKDKDWIDKEIWDKTLEKLTKRLRTIQTSTTHKITKFGKILAFSALLVPIGVPIIAAQLSQGSTITDVTTTPWLLAAGFILTAAPLIAVLGNLIRLKLKSEKDDSEHWAVLTGKTDETITQDTTETPDPTSIEFEKYFSDLVREALAEHTKRKVVAVIDNLDRVEPEVALSSWSTLQTFLQDRKINTEKWFKRFWIVVPYDPSGLRQLWVNRGIKDGSKQEVSVSFIDKSFLVRFEVPPLVLSNWTMYLEKLAATALPEHPEEDYHTIYSVFNLNRVENDDAPTPRGLKLYMNQIGSIHRQWQHQFPIGHIAYYTILRRNSKDIRAGLLDGSIPDEKMESILLPNLKPNLAGLFFNVKATLGQQLLLDGPISNALGESDGKALKELEGIHHDAFWPILEKKFSLPFKDTSPTSVTKVVLCLDQSGILRDENLSKAVTVIRTLGRMASDVPDWSPFDENITNGIATICRLVYDPNVSQRILQNVRKTIMEGLKEDGSEENKEVSQVIKITINGIVKICNQIYILGHQDALSSPFILPVDAQGWIDACSHIKTQEKRYWSHLKPNVQFDELSQLLCEAVTNGHFSGENLAVIQVTNESPLDCNWDSLVQTFGQRLNAGKNPSNDEANFILTGLSHLRQYGVATVQSELKRLADEGHLMHGLHQAQAQNHIGAMAGYICMFLEQNPEATKPPSVGNSDAGYESLTTLLNTDDNDLATHIISILSTHNNLDLLFTIVDKRGSYDPLIIRCLRIVADSETPETLYKPRLIIDHWTNLSEYLKEDEFADRSDRLIRHLCMNSNLTEEAQKGENGFNYNNAGLYVKILEASSSESLDSFRKWCRNGLEAMNNDEWKLDLDNKADALNLVLTLIETGTAVKLKLPYKDALVEHAKDILNKKIKLPDNIISKWSKVLNVLGSGDIRKTFRRELLNTAMNQSGNRKDGFFKMYGEEISKPDILSEEKLVVHKLFTPLIKERSIGGLHWLKNVFSNNPKIIENYTDSASIQDFRERIQDELGKSVDDEAHDLIASIANILLIEPEEAPQQANTLSNSDIPENDASEEE